MIYIQQQNYSTGFNIENTRCINSMKPVCVCVFKTVIFCENFFFSSVAMVDQDCSAHCMGSGLADQRDTVSLSSSRKRHVESGFSYVVANNKQLQ